MTTKLSEDEEPPLRQTVVLSHVSSPGAVVERARAGRLRAVHEALSEILASLQQRETLAPAFSDYLADAIEAALKCSDPKVASKQLASSLGLIGRKKGAPKRGGFNRVFAGKEVFHLVASGVPLKDGRPTEEWDGDGALTRVAKTRHMSVDQVRRGYTKYLATRQSWANHFADGAGRNK